VWQPNRVVMLGRGIKTLSQSAMGDAIPVVNPGLGVDN